MGGVEGVEKRGREADQRAAGALKRNSRRRQGERERERESRKRKLGEERKEKGKFPLLSSAENTGKRGDLKPLDLMKRVGRVFVMERGAYLQRCAARRTHTLVRSRLIT